MKEMILAALHGRFRTAHQLKKAFFFNSLLHNFEP